MYVYQMWFSEVNIVLVIFRQSCCTVGPNRLYLSTSWLSLQTVLDFIRQLAALTGVEALQPPPGSAKKTKPQAENPTKFSELLAPRLKIIWVESDRLATPWKIKQDQTHVISHLGTWQGTTRSGELFAMGVGNKRTLTKTRRKTRDIDQIKADLLSPKHLSQHQELKPKEDLPGLGRWYCVECAKWYDTEVNLVMHRKGKPHKRRYA